MGSLIEKVEEGKPGVNYRGGFFRVSNDAVKSGMFGRMGAELHFTLTAIAAFMGKDGKCYPTQKQLADIMGVSERAAHRRVNALLKFIDDNGNPIIVRKKSKVRGSGMRERSDYTILPNSGIIIGKYETNKETRKETKTDAKRGASSKASDSYNGYNDPHSSKESVDRIAKLLGEGCEESC